MRKLSMVPTSTGDSTACPDQSQPSGIGQAGRASPCHRLATKEHLPNTNSQDKNYHVVCKVTHFPQTVLTRSKRQWSRPKKPTLRIFK